MPASIPVPLNPGETILHTGQGAHLKSTFTGWGYNPYRGQGWVTTQRLIFGHFKGRSTSEILFVDAYPIHRVRSASSIRMKIQFIPNATVLKLVFDNQGREYFWLDDPIAWAEKIMQAQPAAPELPYESIPPARTGVEATPWVSALVGVAVIALILLGSAAVCVLLAVLARGIGQAFPG